MKMRKEADTKERLIAMEYGRTINGAAATEMYQEFVTGVWLDEEIDLLSFFKMKAINAF